MAAFNPLQSHDSSDERAAREPSMEEILASIRRIISDDQSFAAHRDQHRAEIHSAKPLDSDRSAPTHIRKDLGPELDQKSEEAVSDRLKAGWPADDKPSAHTPHLAPVSPPAPVAAVSAPASASLPDARPADHKPPVDHKPVDFDSMHLRERIDETAGHPAPRSRGEPSTREHLEEHQPALRGEEPLVSAATDAAVASSFNALFASRLMPDPEMLAELTRELLRPMLKAWLDDNLPVMVERLVRAEIERVARGGR